MKIRIGIGFGTNVGLGDGPAFARLITDTERLGFDSVWFTERVAGPGLDPVVAMTWAAACTTKLKFGTAVQVLPGRNPVLLAKTLASLDQISGGRLLPGFGLGAVNLAEHQAFGVERRDRSPWFDEALPLLRRLWTEESVEHHGERFHLDGVTMNPKPLQQPLEVWLGGLAPSELRRTGRLGDGWLPSFCTPDDVAAGIPVIEAAAAEAGRAIDPEHYGALLVYSPDGSIPERMRRAVEQRRPDVDAGQIVVAGYDGLATHIEEFIEAGASKFVVMATSTPEDWSTDLARLSAAVVPMQT